MVEDDVTHDSIQNGIAEKLQSLVVDRLSFLVAVHDALVHERHLIIRDVARVDPDDVMDRNIKFPLLAEREPYKIENVIQHTS